MAIPYYIIGTATLTVGSTIMTGQGTLWQGWVKPGDAVIAQEGTYNVVVSVDSNTQITLLRPFRGVAQAGQPYIIMRTPDDVFTQTLTRQLLQTVSDSTLAALAGIPPAPNKLPYLDGSGAAATVDFKAWARSFLGLTTAADKLAYFVDATTTALIDFKSWVRSLFGLTVAANKMVYFTDANTAALTDISAKGRELVGGSDAAAMRVTLALGSMAAQDVANVIVPGPQTITRAGSGVVTKFNTNAASKASWISWGNANGDRGYIGNGADSDRVEIVNYASNAGDIAFYLQGAYRAFLGAQEFAPATDTGLNLGTSARRFFTVYAAQGTINTSDGREKLLRAFTAQEISAAKALSAEITMYNWRRDLSEAGTPAPLYCGLTVQRVIQVFADHGLDPKAYGFIRHDTWGAEPALFNKEGEEVRPAIPAGDRYGLMYDSIAMFIARGFEERLAALEAV
ncbi:MAG TPA: hypothetical protein VGV39_04555 [Mesorhizobium sp.]|jgi:hypothetical protein|uniref:hypothetical protein n=1 Tax=Mesorhizobium sp. TaxID=1871066 RepID=UPI002DDCAC2A|nr:hypothetical protein [Mesorhizobium sp.]HEV2502319.1 hypothetical protein [Mesorhizobium sp.]